MPPIGETLREARVRQRIEIAEVEQATKIRAKYLRALEGEEFDRLPGATFVRQFLRTYAEYLGLDSQLLIEEYRARHESPAAVEPHAFTPPPSSSRAREPRRRQPAGGWWPGRGALIAGAAIAVLAILLIVGLVVGTEEGPDPEEGGGTEASERDDRRDGGARDERRREQGGGGQAGVQLTVSPAGETYVCVEDADGEELFEGIISAPESFRADEALLVNLGNRQVELELNGDEVRVEEGAEPIGLELTADGEQEIPEGERPCT